jgi:hypothetical protein
MRKGRRLKNLQKEAMVPSDETAELAPAVINESTESGPSSGQLDQQPARTPKHPRRNLHTTKNVYKIEYHGPVGEPKIR